MSHRSKLIVVGVLWMLSGCQNAEMDKAAESTTSQPSGVANENTAELDPSDIVWADEAFMESAGVKEGKDVIYLPTPPMVVEKMIEMAAIGPDDLVYDLGTGDGRIAIAAAKQIGCRAVGYEIDPELVKIARENVKKNGVGHLVTIEQQDILTLDFSSVDVVLMYLTADLNVALIPQLKKLKPGARVVSHDWNMRGVVAPDMVVENFISKVPDFMNVHNIYLWKAPLGEKK